MQAGAGGLADGVELTDIGAAAGVHQDSAAGVVCGRYHGDRFAGDVDAEIQAAGVDSGEVGLQKARALVADIQVDTIAAGPLHLVVDSAGHYIPWRQFRPLIEVGHEPGAVR